jgi:hypothetical protein
VKNGNLPGNGTYKAPTVDDLGRFEDLTQAVDNKGNSDGPSGGNNDKT